MTKRILAVVSGLLVWIVIATVGGLILRGTWPEYAAVADAMTFTLPMLFARLSIGGLATLAAGWVTARVAERSTLATLTTGSLLLVSFIPQHIMLWTRFPVWYHLTFLFSLVPLTYVGGTLASHPRIAGARRGPVVQVAEPPSSARKPA